MRDLLICLRPSLGEKNFKLGKSRKFDIYFISNNIRTKKGQMLDLNRLEHFNYKHLLAVI